MVNWFIYKLTGICQIEMDLIDELFYKLPEEYDDEFINIVRNQMYNEYDDVIAMFYQFVLEAVQGIIDEHEIDLYINDYISVYANYSDTKYDGTIEKKEELKKIIEDNELDDYEIVKLFLELL